MTAVSEKGQILQPPTAAVDGNFGLVMLGGARGISGASLSFALLASVTHTDTEVRAGT